MTAEEWRPIPGFDGYEVSDRGRVVSYLRKDPVVLRPSMATNGYWKVCLRRGDSALNRNIHSLVLDAFVGPRSEGMVCRHLDGDPLNNHLTNLTWGSYSENALDRVRHGRDAAARKTSCLHGHAFTPGNTYVTPEGSRRCRTCHRKRDNESRIRRAFRAANVRQASAA